MDWRPKRRCRICAGGAVGRGAAILRSGQPGEGAGRGGGRAGRGRGRRTAEKVRETTGAFVPGGATALDPGRQVGHAARIHADHRHVPIQDARWRSASVNPSPVR